jgi:hypothetical protein
MKRKRIFIYIIFNLVIHFVRTFIMFETRLNHSICKKIIFFHKTDNYLIMRSYLRERLFFFLNYRIVEKSALSYSLLIRFYQYELLTM